VLSQASFVKDYQALRGASSIISATVVAEVGDIYRFPNPKLLMAYLTLSLKSIPVLKRSAVAQLTKRETVMCEEL